MNRSDGKEEYAAIQREWQKLDQQIPVPFAATAAGMKARLPSPGAPAKAKRIEHPKKWAWSLASLALVAVISLALWQPASHLFIQDISKQNAANLQMSPLADAAVPQDAPKLKSEAPSSEAASGSLFQNSEAVLGSSAEEKGRFLPAETYEEIELALANAPASAEETSSFSPTVVTQSSSELGASEVESGGYRYSVEFSQETAQLCVYQNESGALVAQADVSGAPERLFVQEQTLVLAGMSEEGSQLSFWDISNPESPVLARTLRQTGSHYLGAWQSGNQLLIGSVYLVNDRADCIPSVYDSASGQEAKLEPGDILLSESESAPSYALVTSVSLAGDASYTSLAVLGGCQVAYSDGCLTVSTSQDPAAVALSDQLLPMDAGQTPVE